MGDKNKLGFVEESFPDFELRPLGKVIKQAKVKKCGDGDYPVLSMTMHDGLVFQNEKFKKTIASADTSQYKVVNRNQLVISFPIDEGVLATQRIIDAGIVSPAYGIWDIDMNQVDPEFLEFSLRSERAIQYYKSKLRGSTARRRSLPTPTLLEFAIPIPSMKQQKAILEKIHLLQKLIEQRKAQLEQFDTLIKARFVEMFGEPRSNPKNYVKKPLGETCEVVTGNTPARSIDDYYGDFIEWIKTDNIVSGRLNPTVAAEYLSEKGLGVARTVEKNAILMACIAGSVASIGRVCVTDRKVAFNQQINAIVPKDYDVVFLYVLLQISKEYLVEDINMALKGILSKSRLENKVFVVPSIEEQREFANFVAQVDKSKVTIQESLKELETLFNSLMQEYFG